MRFSPALPLRGLLSPLAAGLLLGGLVACTDDLDDDDGCAATSAMEDDTTDLINDYRASLGLTELELDDCVSEVAREHSRNMASGAVAFGHDGFEDRTEEIFVLVPNAQVVGENVAFNQGYADPAQTSYQGWLDSPPHKENIELPDYDMTGMGVVEDDAGGFWFTQLFVGR